ncbi:MAG: signal recognition particle protein [Phycisphaerae bacterium]|nr:signal recognition particle protein [Phycisphaerae bacterium]MCZ2399434.1 signal recognition particle protein [Phycisphaerae bacterium]NUQ49037.1 signal recognition particle protein [Phycisphaerae bacterium]
MFEALSDRLGAVFRSLRGRGRLTEDNVRDAMRQVRTALLEADVNVEIAREFCDHCVQKALGMEVIKTLQPEQVMVRAVYDELVALMGPIETRIPFVSQPPTVILMAGLQGSGKTTTCAKLARYCMLRGKKPLLVAADLKRPAAIDQLEVLGRQIDVPVYAERDHQQPVRVCRNAVRESRKLDRDVVILDSAGRLAIDEELMTEIAQVAEATQPHQIYLVLDAMTGQDAVNTARSFNERLELDGVILTKFDSDTRGGAALSVKKVSGKPIKFIGVGEKLDALEEFHPERVAQRILGMGDVLSLVEKAQQAFDAGEAAKANEKMAKGQLGLDDFLTQLEGFRKMGPIKQVLKLIPGLGSALGDLEMPEEELNRFKGIIHSMTPGERRNPDIIEASRRRRIARGAGVDPQDVSALVKQFLHMRPLMKQMAGMGMGQRLKMTQQLGQMGMLDGRIPKLKAATTRFDPRRRDRKRKRRR